MKTRTALAIIIAATAFVAAFDRPAHSANMDNVNFGKGAGLSSAAVDNCHGVLTFKSETISDTISSAYESNDPDIQAGIVIGESLFFEYVDGAGGNLGVACVLVKRVGKDILTYSAN